MSGYPGSIGSAFPAALGAWAATQGADSTVAGRRVVSVSSDDGIGQYLSEVTTAVKCDMGLTHVVLTATFSHDSRSIVAVLTDSEPV